MGWTIADAPTAAPVDNGGDRHCATMPTFPSLLIATSAFILLTLGAAHLWLTYRSSAFEPRDAALKQRLEEVSPVISRQTTMWRASVGFHASHSAGAMLFGLIYGYLAVAQAAVLFASLFLLLLGLVYLAGMAMLGYRYWFSTPFRGALLAFSLYLAALIELHL
jgi:hypothetical protein